MIKIIPPNAWGWDEPQVELVKVAAAGLSGHDLRALVKRASHPLADWVRKHPPASGETYVHAIALGATENYGCFFAGAPVQTTTGSKPIECVRVGDLVLTHRNRYRPVLRTFKTPYTGRTVSIRGAGLPRAAVSTPEHPFLVVRRNGRYVHAWAESVLGKVGKVKKDVIEAAAAAAEFVAAADVRGDDYLVVPIAPHVGGGRLDDALAYTMGVYLAEGCLTKEYRPDRTAYGRAREVLFSLSAADDQGVLTRMRRDTGKRIGTQPSRTSTKGMRASLYGTELAGRFADWFGWATATEKFVPAVVFNQDRAWKLRFLAGYFDGDGCVVKTGKERYIGTVTGSTASVGLALDIQRLLAGIGIPASVVAGKNRAANGCFGSKDFDIYQVSVGSSYSGEILAACVRLACPIGPRQRQSSAQLGHTYMLVPVRSVTAADVEGVDKYNLEVEEDNSFVVYSAVHNCNRNADGYTRAMLRRDHPTFEKYARFYRLHRNQDPARSYGLIKQSWYNDDLNRVETVVALNVTKEAADRNGGLIADREMDTLLSGRDLAVSQSVKVSHDVCVSCGNKARHRGEYCGPELCKYGGCRDNLGRVFDDGFHLYVDNPDGRFFDLSNVSRDLGSRGADRTAFVTGKVAAAHAPGGAELAERLGLVTPEYLLDPRTLAAAAALRKLAAFAYPHPGAPTWAAAVAVREKLAAHARHPRFPADDAGRHRVLAELAADGVVLPPAAWLAALTGAPAEKCALAFAGGLDPRRDLLERPDLHDRLAAAALTATKAGEDSRLSPPGAYAWLAPSPAAHAAETRLGIVHAASARPVKAAGDCPPGVRAEAKARYLAYQANVLALHPAADLLCVECHRHNASA